MRATMVRVMEFDSLAHEFQFKFLHQRHLKEHLRITTELQETIKVPE